jgi:AraC-like DNA-binding protein
MPQKSLASIRHFQHTAPRRFGHRHKEGQLFVVSQGAVALTTTAGRLRVGRNGFGWIPADLEHEVSGAGPVRGMSCRLSAAASLAFPPESVIRPADPLVAQLLRRLLTIEDGDRQDRLLQVIADELADDPNLALLPSDSGVVGDLITALRCDPANPAGLGDWARALGTSERSLTRRLRDQTGKSFVTWRTQIRIEHARQLLLAGVSVTETALAVGYDSLSAFSRGFRSMTGVLPSAYGLIAMNGRTTDDPAQMVGAHSHRR